MTEPQPRLLTPRRTRVRFFRDTAGTLFAVELVEADRWYDSLRTLPPVEVADARIVLLEHGEMPRDLPGWVGIAPAHVGPLDEAWLADLAERLWLRSPAHRPPGEPPEAYVVAAYHALCPPHPPCPPSPQARRTVIAFARGRSGHLGRLAEEGRDGFDRWLRVCWPGPVDLAREVLLERMLDAGARHAVDVIRRAAEAEVEAGSEFAALALERDALLPRLDPLGYFERIPDFDAAVMDAEAWGRRYAEAYAAHCRRLSAMAAALPSELRAAMAVSTLLRSLNERPQHGAPVGAEALARLDAAVDEIRRIPPEPERVPVPGIVLGRVPSAFAEARLAAAAVLAAVDVHRRRAR